MGFTNRIYNFGEKPFYGVRQDLVKEQYFFIRTGVIMNVDLDKYMLTVKWNTKEHGVRDDIPTSFPFATPSGCIAALPEKGSIGIFGFFDEGDLKGKPLLLTYLPTGLDAGLNFNKVKIVPDALSTSDINEIRFKFRKLTIGDVSIASSAGSSLFLNNNAELRDGMQDSILVREDDQAIISTSLNNFIFTDGVGVHIGPILRNMLQVYDSQGNRKENNGSPMSLLGAKENIYITSQGEPINYDTQYYTEFRVSVDEFGNGKLDLNDINSLSPLSEHDPIINLVLGNYVGHDIRDKQKYGELLKARLFDSAKDNKGAFSLEKAIQTNSLNEPSCLGLVYAIHSIKSQAFIGMDKEGHYYMHLPASQLNPLGAGRSMSILAKGNLKEIWGASAGPEKKSNSWDLTAKGGILWDVGNHEMDYKSRSIDIRTTKGIYIKTKGADDDGYAKVEELSGNVSEVVIGDKSSVCQNYTHTIQGLKTEKINGSSIESITEDKNFLAKNFNETVIKDSNSVIGGSRKTTITAGNDELTILSGNIIETIKTFGKRSTTITSGSIEEILLSGVCSTSVKAGKYKVNVGAGAIEIKTDLGLITISGTTVTIKGTVMVNVDAPVVRVGQGAPIGGVVTGLPGIPSHLDYVTGLPLMGSLKVSAAR